MLIKLLPPSPHPHILFSLSFPPRLPPHLPVPPAWANNLFAPALDGAAHGYEFELGYGFDALDALNLPRPENVHALDKAAFIPTIVHECVFDMSAGARVRVRCLFIDGSAEEWELGGGACVGMLESVLGDVRESVELTEREKARTRVEVVVEKEQEKGKAKETALGLNSPPGSLGRRTHKKQKSLQSSLQQAFLSIVA